MDNDLHECLHVSNTDHFATQLHPTSIRIDQLSLSYFIYELIKIELLFDISYLPHSKLNDKCLIYVDLIFSLGFLLLAIGSSYKNLAFVDYT